MGCCRCIASFTGFCCPEERTKEGAVKGRALSLLESADCGGLWCSITKVIDQAESIRPLLWLTWSLSSVTGLQPFETCWVFGPYHTTEGGGMTATASNPGIFALSCSQYCLLSIIHSQSDMSGPMSLSAFSHSSSCCSTPAQPGRRLGREGGTGSAALQAPASTLTCSATASSPWPSSAGPDGQPGASLYPQAAQHSPSSIAVLSEQGHNGKAP